MSTKCAREECGKTVYPLEELRCLDKVWHKQCLKCTTCGSTLNMKTYKGYEKMPYCESHYPKNFASVGYDTPEMKRIQENAKYQSQVKYTADFEKMKGHKIDVANDPEMERHKQNAKLASNVEYHGETEKKKQQEAVRPNIFETKKSKEEKSTISIAGYDPINSEPAKDEPMEVEEQPEPPKEEKPKKKIVKKTKEKEVS